MSIALDIALLIIILIAVILGCKKGFVKGILGIAALAAAVLCSALFCPRVTPFVQENIIGDSVTEKVQNAIVSLLPGNDGVFDLVSKKPKAFTDILEKFGVDIGDVEEFADDLKNNAKELQETSSAVSGINAGVRSAENRIAAFIARPVADGIAKGVTFLALFIGFFLVFSLVVWIIDLIFKLPILKTANALLGALLGGAKGLLLAWSISAALVHLLPFLSAATDGRIPESLIDGTILMKFLGSLNLFVLF